MSAFHSRDALGVQLFIGIRLPLSEMLLSPVKFAFFSVPLYLLKEEILSDKHLRKPNAN
jgi:hypothetical protein